MSDDIQDLRERADLLAAIQKMEDAAEWTDDIEELRERAALLAVRRHQEAGARGR
jgi:hypothetical protein